MNIPAMEFLLQACGTYLGDGKNEEGLPFRARMELKSRVQDNIIELSFRAEDEGSAFHEELTWLTPDLINQRLCLWTVSSNTPGMLRHELVQDTSGDTQDAARRFVFQMGKPDDQRVFRQEITLELRRDSTTAGAMIDTIEYRYAWAVPHQAMEQRTLSKLRRVRS